MIRPEICSHCSSLSTSRSMTPKPPPHSRLTRFEIPESPQDLVSLTSRAIPPHRVPCYSRRMGSEPDRARGIDELRGERLALERDRLRLERQKLTLELRFKRRELLETQ